MKVLVTGGAGFLGSHFARRARDGGHAVLTVDRAGADRVCDVADPRSVAALMQAEKPDAVVHLAALLTDAAAADAFAATRVNGLGTAAVFAGAGAAGVRRVLYASSIAAVGACAEGSGDDVALDPRTVYGATKAFGEHLARALSQAADGPDFTVLRFGWVYGPGRERGWRTAQELIERFASGEKVVRFPDYPGKMDWTYVDDAGEVLVRALEQPLGRYRALNVLGDRRSIRDAVAHLSRRFPEVEARGEPASPPSSAWGLRNDGLERALGFVPRVSLEQGIDAILRERKDDAGRKHP
jgi:UDP-glucose 4-epimerase